MFEKYFIKYRPFLLIMMILLSAIGYYSFTTLSKESIPEVNLPFFNIVATYPGADATTVEQQVIKGIEDKIPSVKNVATFSSISSDNVGVINVEFQRGTDKGTAYSDLKSAIDEVKSSLPSGVKDVVVMKVDLKDMPVYSFSVVGSYYPSLLYDKVKNIEDDLKKISGIDRVVIVGKYTSQVEVQFDYEKLKKYNLRLPFLVNLISQNISQSPIDKKKLDGNLYSFEVRTYERQGDNGEENLAQFEKFLANMPIVNQNGNMLRVKDVASVTVVHPFYQRLSYVNGQNAVTFMVYKVPGSDILEVIKGIKAYLKDQEPKLSEQKITYKEMASQEIMINDTYSAFINGFRDTSILILIIATIFLGMRGAISIAITFPFVYLLTFIVLRSDNYTFNTIVSAGLNLSLGIMVDNLIVIAQGFQDGTRRGMSKIGATKHSLIMYWKPLLIGNLVTISMFFPLGFVLSGKIGEFLKFLPIAVDVTLIFSIVVAFVFLPLVLSYMGVKTHVTARPEKENNLEKFFEKFEKPFEKIYKSILRSPKLFMAFFYMLFMFTMLLFSKFGSVDFMPLTDRDNIYVNVTYHNDVGITENQKYTSKIYGYINEFFKNDHQGIVKNVELSIGELYSVSALDNMIYRTSFNPNLTKINIVLTSSQERSNADNAVKIFPELNDFLNKKIKQDAQLKDELTDMTVSIQKNGPSGGKDVTFNLSASGSVTSEIKVLANEYEKMLPELKKIPGSYGWSSSLEYSNGKVRIVYDLDKIAQLNLSVGELNAFLYGLNQKSPQQEYLTDYKGNGISISNLNDFGKDVIPVKGYVDYNYGSGKTINFKDLMIPGTNVYFSDVIKEVKLDSQIKSFQHLEGGLVVKIEANKVPTTSLGQIQTKISDIVAKYPKVQLAYAADIKDMEQSAKDMGASFIVGFILMFAILVLNFGNFKQPIVLMSTIPLFLTGAIFFLLITGQSISMIVGIGFFGLIGVGLAHIIYFVNRFNELLENSEGIRNLDEIIIKSVKSRLEPIFLTTTITSIGLFVLAYSDEMWRAFALSFAGGLMLGTTITLIFIPCFLKVVYRKHKFTN